MRLSEIARIAGSELPAGAIDCEVYSIRSADDADETSVTFVNESKYLEKASHSKACAVLVGKGVLVPGKIAIETSDPYAAYARVAQAFEDTTPVFGVGIHPSSVIDTTASVNSTVSIGPLSVLGKNAKIGSGTILGASVIIENDVVIGTDCRIDSNTVIRSGTIIGDRVIIQSGTVIGSEGFGNAFENGHFIRIPCFGNVVIEDDVEIGACVTIDRANFASTTIKRGARIDNLVMIAHNVIVGEDSAMAAQVGISGSTKLGRHVILAGQAGLAGHLEIGDRAFVGAKAGVSKSVDADAKITGYPARDLMQTRRIEAAQLSLPEMRKEIKELKKQVESLQSLISNKS